MAPPRAGGAFKPRKLPAEDLAAYVAGSIANVKRRYQVRVTMHAAADVVRARVTGTPVTVTEIDATSCELKTQGDSLEWMSFCIGFIGVDFEVHEPPELVDFVRATARRFAAAARR